MTVNDFRDVKINAQDGGALVTFDSNSIFLAGIAPAQLSAGNFLFNDDSAVLKTNPHHP